MPPVKALVVGGGIAGPAFAHWLSRTGALVTVIERSSAMRTSGQQIDLRGQGVEVVKRMGILPAVRARRVREPGTQFVDVSGRVWASFPAVETGTGMQGVTSEYEIMRGTLVDILYGLTRDKPNVKHLFDTTVDSFTQDEKDAAAGKVHVRFGDGKEEDFDLVVGADGTGSHTRRMMLGPEAPDPRHRKAGYIAFFSAPAEQGDPPEFTGCMLPGRLPRMIGTRKDVPELTRVYMIMDDTDPAVEAAYLSGDRAAIKAALADLYEEGSHWQCPRLMAALRNAPEADDLYCTPFEDVRLPPGGWSRGRVVLLGDAAHAETANGYGTSYALIGAYLLAGELARALGTPGLAAGEAVAQAAREYEEKWRPVATATQGDKPWFGRLAHPRMVGLTAASGKWKLPEYPELLAVEEQD
ncbi:hypothetical protein RB598_002150 [Gaeumannomyces tritici]